MFVKRQEPVPMALRPLPRLRKCRFLLAVLLLVAVSPQAGEAQIGEIQGQPEIPSPPREKRTLWTCSMHPQVIRDRPGTCPICGMELTPMEFGESAPASSPGERKVKYWWDPTVHPPYIADRPGKSPTGAELIPVYEDEVVAGQPVVIDPRLEQNMGLQLAEVHRGVLRSTVRAYGEIREPESTVREISLRVSGWLVRLYANYEGAHISKGAPLFELYSPELQTAIGEWIAAQSVTSGRTEVRDATRRKLTQLGLTDEQIEDLALLPEPPAAVLFRSPMTAHVVQKLVNEGVRVEAGQPILRVNDRSRMWLDAEVYEQDLPHVHLGQELEARVIGLPGRIFRGRVTFIHPHAVLPARTVVVRAELENKDGELRQGMAATVTLWAETASEALLIPREAVIDTGERKIVFVATEPGHFEPRAVEIGPSGTGGVVGVVRGLAPGEKVVVNGQFLLDAESRLREAARKFLRGRSHGAGNHGAHSH